VGLFTPVALRRPKPLTWDASLSVLSSFLGSLCRQATQARLASPGYQQLCRARLARQSSLAMRSLSWASQLELQPEVDSDDPALT